MRAFEIPEIRAQVPNKNYHLLGVVTLYSSVKPDILEEHVSSVLKVEHCSACHMIFFGFFLDLIFNPEGSGLWSFGESGISELLSIRIQKAPVKNSYRTQFIIFSRFSSVSKYAHY
jgi:hypothetical protein